MDYVSVSHVKLLEAKIGFQFITKPVKYYNQCESFLMMFVFIYLCPYLGYTVLDNFSGIKT